MRGRPNGRDDDLSGLAWLGRHLHITAIAAWPRPFLPAYMAGGRGRPQGAPSLPPARPPGGSSLWAVALTRPPSQSGGVPWSRVGWGFWRNPLRACASGILPRHGRDCSPSVLWGAASVERGGGAHIVAPYLPPPSVGLLWGWEEGRPPYKGGLHRPLLLDAPHKGSPHATALTSGSVREGQAQWP